MVDTIVRPEGPLLRGADRRAAIRTCPGGSAANQAAWLGHFGVPVTLAARVGAADVGAVAAELAAHGVAARLAGDPARPTGAIVTMVDPDGERSFLTDRGANDGLCADDLPGDLLDGTGLLHLSGYALLSPGPRAAVLDLLARARSRGVPLSVDPASTSVLDEVGTTAFLDWTAGAAFCVPNAGEAALLAGSTDPAQQRAALGQRYGCVVIKRGAHGAELVAGDTVEIASGPPVRALDSTGAGDAFLAAFLAAVLAGAALPRCLREAERAGAGAVATVGGRPPTPARDRRQPFGVDAGRSSA